MMTENTTLDNNSGGGSSNSNTTATNSIPAIPTTTTTTTTATTTTPTTTTNTINTPATPTNSGCNSLNNSSNNVIKSSLLERAHTSSSLLDKSVNNNVDQIQKLKEALEYRSEMYSKLTKERLTRAPISQIVASLKEFCFSHEEPLLTDSSQNPWKKGATISSSSSTNILNGIGRSNTSTKVYNEIQADLSAVLALGLENSKLDVILRNMKLNNHMREEERTYYQNMMLDWAITVLRIILKYNIIHAIPLANKNNSNEIAHRIIKVKDDQYNKRPLLPTVLIELKSFWTDPSIQSTFNTHKEKLLPKPLKFAIAKYNICERVFGENPKRLDDAEIFSLIHQPLDSNIPTYVFQDIKITNASALKTEHIDKWVDDFSDVKAFIWIASLASFDTILTDKKFIKSIRLTPKKGNQAPLKSSRSVGTITPSSSSLGLNSSTIMLQPTVENQSILVETPCEILSNNSLQRSIELFKYISKRIKRPAILFLSEKELFMEKVKKSDFKSYFPDYKGGVKDVTSIYEFIKHLFNPPNGPTHITVHQSNLDPKEDLKIITATIYAIVAQESIDILI
ncbi:hypothetical protein CYY_009476 [Polysphondylium violaceum]|uniref:Uncharacterized protein n=1 Tax=Polysphondylium violaceum TaxID=133409 RepID=A0A8J4PLG1_9MYCE|nr:hypothetical protein CYY_009476 [Polysphondylium violaceum]